MSAYRKLSPMISWLIAALGIALLVGIVVTSDLDTESLSIDARSVGVLVLAQVAYLISESLRMQTVLEQAAGMRFGPVFMLRVFTLARVLNLIVPQSGNVYRIAEIKTRYGAAITETAGGMVSFVWMSVSASLFLAAGLSAWGPTPEEATVPDWWLLALTALAVLVGPWLVLLLLGRVRSEAAWLDRLGRLARAPLGVIRDARTMGRFLGLWAVSIAIIVVMYGTAFSMTGEQLAPAALVAIYALVQATSFVVITPGNIGIQDLGFAVIAVAFGADAGAASAAALIIRISGVGVTAIAGAVAALAGRSTAPGGD